MRRALICAIMLAAFALCVGHLARAGMLGGVGVLMAPSSQTGGGIPSNAIVTEAGVPITTQAGAIITTG